MSLTSGSLRSSRFDEPLRKLGTELDLPARRAFKELDAPGLMRMSRHTSSPDGRVPPHDEDQILHRVP
jgi:hypothetical protein